MQLTQKCTNLFQRTAFFSLFPYTMEGYWAWHGYRHECPAIQLNCQTRGSGLWDTILHFMNGTILFKKNVFQSDRLRISHSVSTKIKRRTMENNIKRIVDISSFCGPYHQICSHNMGWILNVIFLVSFLLLFAFSLRDCILAIKLVG